MYYKSASDIAEAVLNTELLPHQQRVVDRLRGQPGLLVAHGLGTGKTLASIAAAVDQPGSTTALVPASLVANYEKELAKHLTGEPNVDVLSMQGAALRGTDIPADLLIVDEAHRARETNTKLHKYLSQLPAEKRMLLTATPVYNRPSDIAPLVNLVAQDRVLPTGSDFDRKYIQKPSRSLLRAWLTGTTSPKLRNKRDLKEKLNTWVDYHQNTAEGFPERIDEEISVPMSKHQTKLHQYAWGQLPLMSRLRLKAGLPPDKKDLPKLNQFQSQARQLSGSLKRFGEEGSESVSPKLERALLDLQSKIDETPGHRAVVYSNYLDSLQDYSDALSAKGIEHGVYSGKVSQKARKQMIEDFNAGNINALLLSSAGGEGLDLKGVRQLQVLEPHWNEEKLDQVIGRAIRQGSHEHLPEDQRNVLVQRYLTYPKPGLLGGLFGAKPRGVEQVLHRMSQDKKKLNEQLLSLLES